jgi:hypothetical protein
MKAYEMVDQTLIALSEFNDGTYDVEVMRFSEIVDSVVSITDITMAIEIYIDKQQQWFGKVLDDGKQ